MFSGSSLFLLSSYARPAQEKIRSDAAEEQKIDSR